MSRSAWAVARWTAAQAGRHHVPGYDQLYKTDYPFDTDRQGQPFAYLIEQAPGTVIRPHFHTVEQFQVIVGGHGLFGRRPVRPPFCHYAGPFTGYGPIEAGAEGLRYLTLRPRTVVPFSEQKAQYLPEQRDRQRREHRKPLSAAGPRDLAARTVDLIAAPDASLPGARHAVVAAGTELAVSGQGYVVVTEGAAHVPADTLEPWDLVYLEPGAELIVRAAEDSSCRLLILRFPATP